MRVSVWEESMIYLPQRMQRPLVAHCHLGLGKLYRRTGKREQAQEHLTTATTMYREMGMMYWLEQAAEGGEGVGVKIRDGRDQRRLSR